MYTETLRGEGGTLGLGGDVGQPLKLPTLHLRVCLLYLPAISLCRTL